MFLISVEDEFSAAHRLREYDGNCEHLHGHNWKVEVTFSVSELDEIGLGIDFRIARKIVKSSVKFLDHTYLNNLDGFKVRNPTCENLTQFLFQSITEQLSSDDNHRHVTVDSITLWESPGSKVTYRPEPAND
jgi:6-pyruvoyltetrahydropterin/6-carboxytetrahydropterin synthase